MDNGHQIPGITGIMDTRYLVLQEEAAPCVVFWHVCALRHLRSCALAGGILTCMCCLL